MLDVVRPLRLCATSFCHQAMSKINVVAEDDLDASLLGHYHAGKLARLAAYEELRATFSALAEVTGAGLESFTLPEDRSVPWHCHQSPTILDYVAVACLVAAYTSCVVKVVSGFKGRRRCQGTRPNRIGLFALLKKGSGESLLAALLSFTFTPQVAAAVAVHPFASCQLEHRRGI